MDIYFQHLYTDTLNSYFSHYQIDLDFFFQFRLCEQFSLFLISNLLFLQNVNICKLVCARMENNPKNRCAQFKLTHTHPHPENSTLFKN